MPSFLPQQHRKSNHNSQAILRSLSNKDPFTYHAFQWKKLMEKTDKHDDKTGLLNYISKSNGDLLMGEYAVSESINFPFQLVLSIVGSILIGAYALSQPNENSDDDDFGNGDGGMMQPVAATGAI